MCRPQINYIYASVLVRNNNSMLAGNGLMIKHKVTSLRLAAKDVATPNKGNAIKNLTILENLERIDTRAGVDCPVRGPPSGLAGTKLREMVLVGLTQLHERGRLGRCKREREGGLMLMGV